jgi:hypothetical protein
VLKTDIAGIGCDVSVAEKLYNFIMHDRGSCQADGNVKGTKPVR